MLYMRISSLLISSLLCSVAAFAAYKFFHKAKTTAKPAALKKARAAIAPSNIKSFVKKNNFNATHCFLIDMSIPSNEERFFVYNIQKDSVELAGLVAHGSGRDNSNEIVFSNLPNSLCTSLGKYKVGVAYNGKFGLAFKLHGLDASNSNAFARAVVLHAHGCVPDESVDYSICESWGCPTVSPKFLTALNKYIKNSNKPILMNIAN